VIGLLTIAAILVLYGVVSKPLDARGVTSAMVFTAAGFLVGTSLMDLVDVELESATAERLAEVALALLLFTDAARIDLRSLRRQLAWPGRLLLIGLPLTMLAGLGAGLLVFPGMAVATAFLLSTMLCSTDAALGQRVVTDPTVPDRVRQALDVESGLNDGLAVPFFLVAVDISRAELSTGFTWAVVTNAAQQIGWGLLAGVAAGALGGSLFRLAARRGWLEGQWRQTVPLAAALLAYAVALSLGGSGFIAAFVGGMAFGRVAHEHGLSVTYFTEETGGLLAAVTWIGFGALALGWALPYVTWQIVLYAALSLTVVRMVPVAIAMLGHGARWPTVAFMGWFGPRGLASIVFGLIALEEAVPETTTLLTTVIVTVSLSVVAHGLTSVPFAAAYHRWYEAHTAAHPRAVEAAPAAMPRPRRQMSVADITFAERDHA
jgi:NhaP-type Na+/H+ or K+/H+ antiporter